MAAKFRFRVKDPGPEIEKRMINGLRSAVRTAGIALKEKLSVPFPRASVHGEYPRRRTGQGVANVVWEVNEDQLVGGFGYAGEQESNRAIRPPHTRAGAEHLTILALKGRKGPAELFFEKRSEIEAAFKKGARQ